MEPTKMGSKWCHGRWAKKIWRRLNTFERDFERCGATCVFHLLEWCIGMKVAGKEEIRIACAICHCASHPTVVRVDHEKRREKTSRQYEASWTARIESDSLLECINRFSPKSRVPKFVCLGTNKAYHHNLWANGSAALRVEGLSAFVGKVWALDAIVLGHVFITSLLPPHQHSFASAIDRHCRALGNCDRPGPVPCIYFPDSAFVTVKGKTLKQARGAIAQLLAFLIDHCRVMYRPLALHVDVVKKMLPVFGTQTLAGLVDASDGMPRPLPYFMPFDDYWMWVPVKKPRSCDLSGAPYIPLPKREPEPPLFTLPPNVTFTAHCCFDCASKSLAACSPACRFS